MYRPSSVWPMGSKGGTLVAAGTSSVRQLRRPANARAAHGLYAQEDSEGFPYRSPACAGSPGAADPVGDSCHPDLQLRCSCRTERPSVRGAPSFPLPSNVRQTIRNGFGPRATRCGATLLPTSLVGLSPFRRSGATRLCLTGPAKQGTKRGACRRRRRWRDVVLAPVALFNTAACPHLSQCLTSRVAPLHHWASPPAGILPQRSHPGSRRRQRYPGSALPGFPEHLCGTPAR